MELQAELHRRKWRDELAKAVLLQDPRIGFTDLGQAPAESCVAGPATSAASSSSSAQAMPKRQAGYWPSTNSSVNRFKKQNITAAERQRRDFKISKKIQKRQEKSARQAS